MSRGIMRGSAEICADCSAPDPTWASVNRGVFVCAECCGVHRSLGRHISHVRSLTKGQWVPQQLAMVKQLVSMGANSIWEYSLLEPGHSRKGRKPQPRDPIHPNKEEFIRRKYQNLAFVNKHKDTEVTSVSDLSQQLHASARTGNLETSLRLLSLGADPNYFHIDKGTTCLHVAAMCNQPLQVELLLVYGADPGSYDANGLTPDQLARKEKSMDLADRLVESQYEVTDRLTQFLCGKRPDHKSSQHFVIPAMADNSMDMSELAKAAKIKLQALPNHHFEELTKDAYDEVDRRENDTIWISQMPNHQHGMATRESVPFLPVNPEFSPTRNQGRQKLARFNMREFKTLIIDILSDVKRRQGQTLGASQRSYSLISDDEPLYDSVASDEDYASVGDNQSLKDVRLDGRSMTGGATENGNGTLGRDTDKNGSEDSRNGPLVDPQQYVETKKALLDSQKRVSQLAQSNRDLQVQINKLQAAYQHLQKENETLRSNTSTSSNSSSHHTPPQQPQVGARVTSGQRPASMFEPREQHARNTTWTKHPAISENSLEQSHSVSHIAPRDHKSGGSGSKNSSSGSLKSSRSRELEHQTDSMDSDYDNAATPEDVNPAIDPTSEDAETQLEKARDSARSGSSTTPTGSLQMLLDEGGAPLELPTQDQVVKKTEKITKKIQELLRNAQDGKHEGYGASADKIYTAVNDMVALFPTLVENERIEGALHQLTLSAERLCEQCSTARTDALSGHDQYKSHTQQVIQCAYDIAQAAKSLVCCFE